MSASITVMVSLPGWTSPWLVTLLTRALDSGPVSASPELLG
jgi:hypothetical protein